ncbi:MAG: hypothetical protein M1823_004070 [Watsoniomyces obsoletus]|nr:MAG: hypothetical protein M1823_004070 [Watsoniomyces obsoletus]
MEAQAPSEFHELIAEVMNLVKATSPATQAIDANDSPNRESAGAPQGNERRPPVQRRTSSAVALYGTPPPRRANSEMTASPFSPDGGQAENGPDGNSPTMWSSAVGRATTGKSGRVIERIQAENDRLRRELNFETERREEEQRRGDMARAQVSNLEMTNGNLVHISEQFKAQCARATTKSDELKKSYALEQTRRQEAEGKLRQATLQHENRERELRTQLEQKTEQALHANAQYAMLSSSWKSKVDECEGKVTQLKGAVELVRMKHIRFVTDLGRKIHQLETTVEGQRKELEKLGRAKDGVSRELETHKRQANEELENIKKRARRNEEAHDEAMAAVERTKGEMNHLINLKRFVRDPQADNEEDVDEENAEGSTQ